MCADHQPQARDSKQVPFDATPAGISGLETWLPLMLKLHAGGAFSLSAMIALMTSNPSEILGIGAGTLGDGKLADICIFDPDEQWTLNEQSILSSGKNTPFLNQSMHGRVRITILGGKIIFQR